MYLVDALARSSNVDAIPLLHEQSVGIAAEAYSQFTGKLSVALVTTGPGGTNALTACAAAWAESTPMLFISGQVKTENFAGNFGVRQYGFQEVAITDMARPITKYAHRVQSSEEFPEILQHMVEVARSGRPGPVWLDIPLDIQNTDFENAQSLWSRTMASVVEPTNELLEAIAINWVKAERPLLLVGNGVRLAHALPLMKELIERTQCPTALTWKTIDFLTEDDLLNAGRPGGVGQRWSNFAIQSCDFLLTIGARLDMGQTAYRVDNFAPLAKKYSCDIDVTELNKLPTSFSKINCDALALITGLNEYFKSNSQLSMKTNWVNRILEWKIRYPILQPKHHLVKTGVNLYYFLDKLSFKLSEGAIIVPGSSGACSEVTMQAFQVKPNQRILNSQSLGPMGFGIPAAIGVCIASKLSQVICIDGDGGFQMNIQELATVRYRNLPIKFFVLNNNGYGSIKATQDAYFEGRRLGTDGDSGLGLPCLERIAFGFDIPYRKIQSNSEVVQSLESILSLTGPEIIELIVEPNQITEPRVTSRMLAGKMVTSSMEDMNPILDSAILRRELFF